MKVLHVFYSFLPDLSGSSIRSAGLVSGQLAQGIPLAIVSSPFQPGFGADPVEEYRGARVYRAYRNGAPRISEKGSPLSARARKAASLPEFAAFVRRVAKEEGATVIHAHSTFFCGMASWLAARTLGIPVVYEFRSLWEERARNQSLAYRAQSALSRELETLALRAADRVVTINEGLKAEVVARGVPASRVDVVPNAVDDALVELGGTLEPPRRVTRFGYVGNLSAIEGLDVLLRGFLAAFPSGEDVELLFHGTGPYEAELRRLVEQAGDPRVKVCGAFTRDRIVDVYRSVDCVVLARHRSKLNDTVTPLKPLEAMAFNRVVGISDAQGLVEVVGNPANAWTFPAGNVEKLASELRRVWSDGEYAPSQATRGRAFVSTSRRWNSIAAGYLDTYSRCRSARATLNGSRSSASP